MSRRGRRSRQRNAFRCPYCGELMQLVDSIVIYKVRSYGNAWTCSRYPECDTYVGCHKGSHKPLGTPANAALRKARNEAHELFDMVWLSGDLTRTDAYAWLAGAMDVTKEKCHIAMFDEGQCHRVVEIVQECMVTRANEGARDRLQTCRKEAPQ